MEDPWRPSEPARTTRPQGSRRTRRPLTRRRLLGLDRSGPDPLETRSGEPLRPLTIPNLVGYARLLAIPLFLYLAFDSEDGRTLWSAAIFGLIAFGDYLDGLLARATGQYSRLGALLDPVVDRLLILAGAAVCWHFALLPRWALVLAALREVAILVLARAALRRGVDVEINWLGRSAVWGLMGGIFLALSVETWVAEALFIGGLVIALAAGLIYVRSGLQRLRAP